MFLYIVNKSEKMQLANICLHISLHAVEYASFCVSNTEHPKTSLNHCSSALVHHSILISFGLQPLVLFGRFLKHLATGQK